MLRRQRTGSVICSSCGVLVGINDDRCYNCGRRNPGMWGYAPLLRSLGADLGFVPFVIGTCGIVYVLTLIASRGAITQGGMFSFLGPSTPSLILFGASGGVPVFVLGRWWTVLSAAWLHAGLLHIMFNMFAVRQLGPPTADFYGPARTILIYTAGAIAGFTLSSFAYEFLPSIDMGMIHLGGSPLTVGASASISGLIGALVYYGRRTGSTLVRTEATRMVVMLVFYGFLFRGIDNYAHAGGFGGGYLAARLLDPLKHERGDHVILAVFCLVLSVVSIVVSVIHGIGIF
jgi:rhomboid protease GluP